MDDRTFVRQWVVANGVAEMLGLGSTFVLGLALAPTLADDTSVGGILLLALVAVLAGMMLEGVVVGAAQGRVLHSRRPSLGVGSWVTASGLGAAAAWFVGMVPSTTMALASTARSPGPRPAEPGPLLQLALAMALGAAAGPILGVFQWRVLKRHVARSRTWLWANLVAWAVGMPVIFAGMDMVPWEGSPGVRTLSIYLVCLVAGMVVGAVHGPILMRLTRPPSSGATP
jgi:hypothetical protein